jgi:cadmium resistance protein CadD (predicted permease)
MEMIATLILFVIGFVAFFATGIDDTIAYAGLYLKNKKRDHKKFISFGIVLGTIIALVLSIFVGSLMEKYIKINGTPIGHLVGGAVLVTLGVLTFIKPNGKAKHHKKTHAKIKKHLKVTKHPKLAGLKFIGLGMLLFFATGVDDIIAYSNLIMAKGAWVAICSGVLIATFVSLLIAHFLAGKLKRFSHPERIGGAIMIIIGILLGLKIL